MASLVDSVCKLVLYIIMHLIFTKNKWLQQIMTANYLKKKKKKETYINDQYWKTLLYLDCQKLLDWG